MAENIFSDGELKWKGNLTINPNHLTTSSTNGATSSGSGNSESLHPSLHTITMAVMLCHVFVWLVCTNVFFKRLPVSHSMNPPLWFSHNKRTFCSVTRQTFAWTLQAETVADVVYFVFQFRELCVLATNEKYSTEFKAWCLSHYVAFHHRSPKTAKRAPCF